MDFEKFRDLKSYRQIYFQTFFETKTLQALSKLLFKLIDHDYKIEFKKQLIKFFVLENFKDISKIDIEGALSVQSLILLLNKTIKKNNFEDQKKSIQNYILNLNDLLLRRIQKISHLNQFELLNFIRFFKQEEFKCTNSYQRINIVNQLLKQLLNRVIEQQNWQLNISDIIQLSEYIVKTQDKQFYQKLVEALYLFPTNDLSLQQLSSLYNAISWDNQNQSKENFIGGHEDRNLFFPTLQNFQITSLYNFQTKQGFLDTLQFFENIFKKNPTILIGRDLGLRIFGVRSYLLNKVIDIDLKDQIRLATLFINKVNEHTFFFPEILENSEKQKSFRDIDFNILYKFVEAFIEKIEQNSVYFEHLKSSMQFKFKQINLNEITVQITRKIKSQLLSNQNITKDNLRICAKIFNSQQVQRILWKNDNEIETTFGVYIKHWMEIFKTPSEFIMENNKDWHNFFGSLFEFQQLIPYFKNENLKEDFNQCLQQGIKILDHAILNQVQMNYDFTIQDYLKLYKIINILYQNMKLQNEQIPKFLKSDILNDICYQIIIQHLISNNSSQIFLKHFNLKNSVQNRSSQLVQQTIMETNKHQIYRELGPLLYFFDFDLNQNKKYEHKNHLKFLKKIPNIRSIKSQDLLQFYNIIENKNEDHKIQKSNMNQLQILQEQIDRQKSKMEDSRKIMMLAVSNIQSIIQQEYQIYINDQENEILKSVNDKQNQTQKQKNRQIIDLYLKLYEFDQKSLEHEIKTHSYNLLPFSFLVAKDIQDMSHQQILLCLKLLKLSNDIHQFDKDFLILLHERYSQSDQISQLLNNGVNFFLDFADSWPFFLSNEKIISEIQKISSTTLVKQQTAALKILAQKNRLDQSLISANFETISKLKDKQSVKDVLPDFIRVCAYLGCTNGYDVQLLVQIFRRIFKMPQEIGQSNLDVILDLLTILALSQINYQEFFDEKSKKYIDSCLDYVEKYFVGFKYLENQNQTLNYFQGIKSEKKLFNKVIEQKKQNTIDQNLIFQKRPIDSFSLKKQYLDLDENEIAIKKINEKDIFKQTEEKKQNDVNFILIDLKDENLEDKNEEENEAQDDLQPLNIQKVKSYDVKAKENQYSRFNEELQYLKSRKMKLSQMNKKQKHLFLFTNFDSLNFVNINKNNEVKAWAVLYHFRSKSIDSFIYEEFSSIVMRNCKNKVEGHDLFNQFYKDFISYGFRQNSKSKIDVQQNCQISGWPIDIQIRTQPKKSKNFIDFNQIQIDNSEDSSDEDILDIKSIKNKIINDDIEQKKQSNFILQFFLQEEMCFNTGQNQEQPLGMQQLMLRHLKNATDTKIDQEIIPNVKYLSEGQLKEYLKNYENKKKSKQQDLTSKFVFEPILQSLWQ